MTQTITNQTSVGNLVQGQYYVTNETVWFTKVDKDGKKKGKPKKFATFQRWFRAETSNGKVLATVRLDPIKKGGLVTMESSIAKANKLRWTLGKKAKFIPDRSNGK